MRKGLVAILLRKIAARPCILDCSGNPFGAAKRLERKARFAAFYAANAPKFRIINEILNWF
jgi:hypothetical protein